MSERYRILSLVEEGSDIQQLVGGQWVSVYNDGFIWNKEEAEDLIKSLEEIGE